MRVIIPAAGEGSRWKNFRGTPKHLTLVENEILINRTVKQFRDFTNDVVIVSTDSIDTHARIEKPLIGNWNDAAKLYSSAHLWSESARNIIAFGDVWFSDDAVRTVVGNSDPVQFFLRPKASKITGKGYKEIFAMAFDGGKKEFVRNTLESVIKENKKGPGTYLLYKKIRQLEHKRVQHHFNNKSDYVEINDWTEDFDHPHDLVKWEIRRLSSAQNRN
jgi:hypothetical protein